MGDGTMLHDLLNDVDEVAESILDFSPFFIATGAVDNWAAAMRGESFAGALEEVTECGIRRRKGNTALGSEAGQNFDDLFSLERGQGFDGIESWLWFLWRLGFGCSGVHGFLSLGRQINGGRCDRLKGDARAVGAWKVKIRALVAPGF